MSGGVPRCNPHKISGQIIPVLKNNSVNTPVLIDFSNVYKGLGLIITNNFIQLSLFYLKFSLSFFKGAKEK